jgi:hypothetical protein
MIPLPRVSWYVLVAATIVTVPFAAADARAQGGTPPPRQVSTALVGGVTSSVLSLPLATVFPIPELEVGVSRRTGFTAGVVAGIPAGRTVTFDTGAMLSQRGMAMTATHPLFGSARGSLRMTYLDVPAHIRARIADLGRCGISLFGGPTLGIRLDARTRVEAVGQTQEMEFTNELPALDLGLAVGGRLDVGRALVIVSYLHGLTDTTKGDAPEAVKHRVWSVLAGVRF